MRLVIPELSLVLLAGPTGSGKTTFARKHFKASEILSIEQVRELVADDAIDPAAYDDAFASMSYLAMRRLSAGRMTVIDDRNLDPDARKMLIGLAREHHVVPVGVVFHLPEAVLHQRNRARGDDVHPPERIAREHILLRQQLAGLEKEGFRHIFEFLSLQEVESVEVQRQRPWNRRTDERGPFDIVGDVHGCYDELRLLLQKLGYLVYRDGDSPLSHHQIEHPLGRRLVFLGDLAGHGPKIVETLRLVMDAVDAGLALTVPGDHDARLVEWLHGHPAIRSEGLDASARQMEETPEEFRQETRGFLSSTVSHYVFDDGKLVVAHAGLPEALQGRGSLQVRQFAIHGERLRDEATPSVPSWPKHYNGRAEVVYGHCAVRQAQWVNRTICIDTACVFGGKLTALRYPERELVSVDALRTHVSLLSSLFAPAHALPVPHR